MCPFSYDSIPLEPSVQNTLLISKRVLRTITETVKIPVTPVEISMSPVGPHKLPTQWVLSNELLLLLPDRKGPRRIQVAKTRKILFSPTYNWGSILQLGGATRTLSLILRQLPTYGPINTIKERLSYSYCFRWIPPPSRLLPWEGSDCTEPGCGHMAKQLTDVIGCCICLGIPQAWIYQCENGHSYCDKGHTVQVNDSWTSLVCTSNQEQLKPRLIKEPFVSARTKKFMIVPQLILDI